MTESRGIVVITVEQMSVLFVVACVGFLCARRGIVDPDVRQKLTRPLYPDVGLDHEHAVLAVGAEAGVVREEDEVVGLGLGQHDEIEGVGMVWRALHLAE